MKNTVWICLASMMLAACNGAKTGNDEIPLAIVPSVVDAGMSAGVPTRARITGTAFPVNSTVGLSITPVDPANLNVPTLYNDIFATYNGALWNYYLDNTPSGTTLAGFSSWDEISIDGYFPYNIYVTDFSSIPFRVANETTENSEVIGTATEEYNTASERDYMVAKRASKVMTAGSGFLSMQFYHLLTALDVRMQLAYDGLSIRLVKAKFEIDGGQKFVIAGNYNAVNPTVSNMSTVVNTNGRTEVSTIDMTYSSDAKLLVKDSITSPMLMIPELRTTGASDDAQITVTLTFEDLNGNHYEFEDLGAGEIDPSYTFKLSDITNKGAGRGMLAGYVYILRVTVGTYIKFEGPPQIVMQDIDDDDNPEYIDV